MTSPTSEEPRVPLNVTLIEVTDELVTAYHSVIQAWPDPPLRVPLDVQFWLEVSEIFDTVTGLVPPWVLASTIITSFAAQLSELTVTVVPLDAVLLPVHAVSREAALATPIRTIIIVSIMIPLAKFFVFITNFARILRPLGRRGIAN